MRRLGKILRGSEMRGEKAGCEAVARIIRQNSRQGELTSAGEIFGEAVAPNEAALEQHVQEDAVRELLGRIREEDGDIREILGRTGVPHYYSTMFMTETYAGILLKKEEDPSRLIAEIVRENAAQYPRPTSIDFLGSSPFEMSQEQITACLEAMAAEREYGDIERLSTSVGTLFLYSTLYLEPAHASMLAEWIDVGQFENP